MRPEEPKAQLDQANPGAEPAKPAAWLHATTVARDGWALVLRGPSGSGKSDLALRLIEEAGFALLADDQTPLFAPVQPTDPPWVGPPERLSGQIEVRGLGILPARRHLVQHLPVALVVDLQPDPAAIERLPEAEEQTAELDVGAPVPRVFLWAFEVSARLKVVLAWERALARMAIVPDSERP
ncbi:MAG: HPr kinase/phosphorylase [Rhodospirillaceae bacterium]